MKKNIVFLGVGDDGCGDAILIRLWDGVDEATQHIVLIDGGYKNDWIKVQELVHNRFGAEGIDLVISTHPDNDHINGLPGVIENIGVKKLWMHLPWEHDDEYLLYRQDQFKTLNATDKFKNSLQSSNDLILAAEANGIHIEEPFAGKKFTTPFGVLTVLSPTVEFYEELLPQMLEKSAAKNAGNVLANLNTLFGAATEKITNKLFEDHDIETLTNSGTTSPSNNSSTVILLELIDGKKLLFTGDAGKEGLDIAHQIYSILGHGAGELDFIQVPHHGSRQNVGPDILDRFLGEKLRVKDQVIGKAFVSAGSNCLKDGHPKKSVSNAFKRRGYPVFHNAGKHLKHGDELAGFTTSVEPLPHYSEVEE